MPPGLDNVLRHQYAAVPVSWTARDRLTYDASIGREPPGLEIPTDYKPTMTYFAALYLQGTGVADSPLLRRLKGELTPGFPAMDPRRTVHVGQSIELLRLPPLESGPGWPF
ncbi:hypothetical protein GGG16DRAFT_111975 [Schizophyllum commune]